MSTDHDRKGIARRLAALRGERGLSQAAVAALAGCNQRSIAEIEKAGSFSVRLLRDVAAALGVTEQWLRTGGGTKGAPPGSGATRGGNVRIEKRGTADRDVPVVSWATAGAAKDYHDLGDFLDETVRVACDDANAFAVIVEGDSMEPDIHAGDRIVVLPNREAQSGDLVIARTRKGHEVYFKKFLRHGPRANKVRLMSFNTQYPPLEFDLSDFRFIYPVAVQVRYYNRKS